MKHASILLLATATMFGLSNTTLASTKIETRAFVTPNCLVSYVPPPSEKKGFGPKAAGTIAATIIPVVTTAILNKVIGGLVTSAKKKFGDKISQSKTRINSYLFKTNKNFDSLQYNQLGCVTIISGDQFGGDTGQSSFIRKVTMPPRYVFKKNSIVPTATIRKILKLNDILYQATPAIVFEFAILKSDDGTAFRAEARYLSYFRTLKNEKHVVRKSIKRDLSFTFEIFPPGIGDDKSALTRVAFSFPNLSSSKTNPTNSPIKILTYEGLRSIEGSTSDWLPMPGASKAVLDAFKVASEQNPKKPPSLDCSADSETLAVRSRYSGLFASQSGCFGPILTDIAVHETKKGSKLGQFLADLLSSSAEDISKAVATNILPPFKGDVQKLKAEAQAACIEYYSAVKKAASADANDKKIGELQKLMAKQKYQASKSRGNFSLPLKCPEEIEG